MNNARMTILMVIAVLVMAAGQGFGYTSHTSFNDGGSHLISDNSYENSFVELDNSIAHDPGTHVDMVDGGKVSQLYLWKKSSLTMTGGTISSLLRGWQNSSLTISGGTINDFYALDNSTATITGGMIQDELAAGFNSTITMSGGTFGRVRAYYNGTIHLVGTDFAVNGRPLSYGDKLSDFGTLYPVIQYGGGGTLLNCYAGTITGTLADGSHLNNTFYVNADGTAEIIVIPEPATLLLLGLGAVMLRKPRT